MGSKQGSRETVDAGTLADGGPVVGPMAAKLVVVAGTDEGLEVPLDDAAEIGSDPSCQMVLKDPSVSRRHVSVRRVGGRIVVKDLGSRNGTYLGGAKLAEAEVPLGAVL